MKTKDAQRFCDEINALNTSAVADIEHLKSKNSPDYPCVLRVRHSDLGNEIGFASTYEEALYLIRGIKRMFRQKGEIE